MARTAETYSFGARAPYATLRAREHDMKERARLSGLLPRVRNEPVSKKLQALLKEFEQNAAPTALLERRRALEGRSQYDLQAVEAIDDMNQNLVPWARMGRAVEANNAKVAQQVAGEEEDAAVVTSMGGSESTSQIRRAVRPQAAAPKAAAEAAAKSRGRSPSNPA